jgi:KDO transferase-3
MVSELFNRVKIIVAMSGLPFVTRPFLSIWRRAVVNEPAMNFCNKMWSFFHSHPQKHNRRLWPYVREVKRDSQNNIESIRVSPCTWKIKLTSFSDVPRPKGNTVHLILSGPSIKEIDYSQLKLPCVMGVNGSIALCHQYDLSFKYYVIIDEKFVRGRLDLVKEIVAQDVILFARSSVLKAINLLISPHFVKCRFVAFEEIDTPAYQERPSQNELLRRAKKYPDLHLFSETRCLGFSFNPQYGLFGARTVAYDALQILVWLGFTKIYIHGLDLTNAQAMPRFYETAGDQMKSTLHENYSNRIAPSFCQAGKLLREHGIEVYNLSLNSALDESVFPKISWREIKDEYVS